MTGGQSYVAYQQNSAQTIEYTMNSTTLFREHLVVRTSKGTKAYFALDTVTDAACTYDSSAPLPAGANFNYLAADGTGRFGSAAKTAVAGYTFRVEIHLPADAAGNTTATLVVQDASGNVVYRTAGALATAGTETEY